MNSKVVKTFIGLQAPTHPIFRKLELTDLEWNYLYQVKQILKVKITIILFLMLKNPDFISMVFLDVLVLHPSHEQC